MSVFWQGASIGGGLIVAIGAQNTFLLTQALARKHHIMVALVCSLCDIFLISAGVLGVGNLLSQHEFLLLAARFLGAGFLFFLGWQALVRIFKAHALDPSERVVTGRKAALLTTLSVTLLNPHAYLDAVIMLGGIASQYGDEKMLFAAGALTASVIWFFGLSLGAARLAPFFSNPRAWQCVDALVVVSMWGIAISLLVFNPM